MAGITTDESNQIKILGADGVSEATVTTNNELQTSDTLLNGGVQGEITIGTSAVEGKVGASKLADRKYVIFQALDKGIYFGATSGVTTANGMPIYKNQLLMIPKGSDIWFIADGAGKLLRLIEEA